MTNRTDNTASSQHVSRDRTHRSISCEHAATTAPLFYHVMSRIDGGWSVYRSGAARATRIHASKAQALKHAREIARSLACAIVIHYEDGMIQKRMSYAGRAAFAGARRR